MLKAIHNRRRNTIQKLTLKKIWKNTYKSYRQPFTKDLHNRLLNYSTKMNMYMHKYAQETTILTVSTADLQKITKTYLYTAQE